MHLLLRVEEAASFSAQEGWGGACRSSMGSPGCQGISKAMDVFADIHLLPPCLGACTRSDSSKRWIGVRDARRFLVRISAVRHPDSCCPLCSVEHLLWQAGEEMGGLGDFRQSLNNDNRKQGRMLISGCGGIFCRNMCCACLEEKGS